jgi:AraC family transcriptional regulator, regulatory protein of adaptative response / methylphosphotriester-DNA alkyltransferase methyltransferase
MPVQRPITIRYRTTLFEEATAIVEAEYASELSLDEIAHRIASSRRQLQRAYAEIGTTTFRDHLTGVRMARAAELLAERSMTVREVADRVGYRQPAQFAKAFRRHHGVSPSDYRAAVRAGRPPQRDAAPFPRVTPGYVAA